MSDGKDVETLVAELNIRYDDAIPYEQAYPFFAAEGLDGTYYQHDDATWERVPDGEFRGPEGAFCVAPTVLR